MRLENACSGVLPDRETGRRSSRQAGARCDGAANAVSGAKAGLPLVMHADMLPVQWVKLLLNLNNSINALANRPLKEELAQPAYRRCLGMAQSEALALLARAGIRPARSTPVPPAWMPHFLGLPDARFARLGRAMLTIDPLARSSMSDDLEAGRATEVDWINGEVVKLARRLGLNAPVNKLLCELAHDAERSKVRPSWTGDPLLSELRAASSGALTKTQLLPA
ncbi:hypothetical protein GCT13_23005 [Paraburkholderia sp. CNPSo 3157]|uniref:Ketopantoate reductase C-terminal domain-containing protein n=1 Tax=Paraburkholderia franconis TaxID=2654983 RepID=A0A7X1NCY9_9BURK|nr:hypothetical protein [Paraburkholderia franconis]